jgi:tetratricopeptide (TPR) repeat protein
MSEAPKVFISYSHDSPKHMDRVLALSNHLRAKGIDCSIDQYEESPPEGWPQWCDNQVEESRFVLVACTDTYLRRFKGKGEPRKGLGATWEGHIVTQELYNAQGKNEKFIPVVLSQQDGDFIPVTLQSATCYDAADAQGLEKLYRRLTGQPSILKPELGELVEMLPKPAPAGLQALPELGRKQNFLQPWNVPIPPNPFFTGREQALRDIDVVFKAGRAAALTGLGGVGKTQTAARYACLHRDEYKAVLWVSAATRETLVSGFAALAGLLSLPEAGAQDQAQAVAAVKRWLEANNGWLLVLDNANELALVRELGLHPSRGRLLLTTQAQALGGLARPVEILEMQPEEGALFLLRRAGLVQEEEPWEQAEEADRPVALEISKELGGLPLALDQAGAYLEETQCGLAKYLALYRREGAELRMRRGGIAPDHASVAATFALSFGNVKQASEAAAEVLRLCAFLHPDAIPAEILTEGAPELGPILAPAAAKPTQLDEAIGAGLRYSLLRRRDGTLSIHRLVQQVIQDGLTDEEQRQWAERAVRAVNAAFPDPSVFANWGQCERLLPQALACAGFVDKSDFDSTEAALLLNRAGYYLDGRARYAEAEPLYQRSLALAEHAYGPDHPNVASSLNNLAELYRAEGKHAEAEPLYKRSLAIDERAYGPDHPDVATDLNNLALLYRAQGKYADAEPLFQRSLAILENALGPDQPTVATSLNNLASLYAAQGKYAEAEPLYKRSLAIRVKALGPDHPDVAASLNNLAELHRDQGKYAEAEPLYQRSLAILEKALGPEHPNVASNLNNLALLYRAHGKYAEAEPLYKRSLAIDERVYGPDHPDVARDLNNLASLYRAQGKYAEAEPLYQRALAIFEKALGPVHPNVATALENYAALLRQTGREKQAEEMEARARAIRAKQAPAGG